MRYTLQSLAGRDSFLADQSSTSEQKMFNALGLLVFVITLVTLSSTAYALYLINQHRGSSNFGHYFALYFVAPLTTIAWTLIVFNFFRFTLSSSSGIKNSFEIKNVTRLLISIFFGLIIGITISVPISVSISHEELKDSLLGEEVSIINQLEDGIDQKYQDQLIKGYQAIVIASNQFTNDKDRVERLSKLKNAPESQISEATTNSEQSAQKLSDVKAVVDKLRAQIKAEKMSVEQSVKANDGLITNLLKALAQNKYLIILIALFICTIIIFPSIYQAYYVPGIYDHLIEYKNHIVLARHGVLPHAHSIFIKTDEVKVAYNTLPEELLREEIKILKESFKKEQSQL